MNMKILIIDDEAQNQKLLRVTLESAGFDVLAASTGKEGISVAADQQPHLIILGLELPDESGRATLKKLRVWFTRPIIIVSVQHSEEQIVGTLDDGANDYLIKPLRTAELLARIRTAMRNSTNHKSSPVIEYKNFEIDLSSRSVKVNNELLKLTSIQYSLLVLLGKNEGRVLTHQYILREVWGEGYISQLQYLRVYIAQLRKKVEKNADSPHYIRTESGVGYRFVVPS
jgi:two-component system KDP operon response regulator KdpE